MITKTEKKDVFNREDDKSSKKAVFNNTVKKRFTTETQDTDKRTKKNKKYSKNTTTDNIKEGSHNETYEKIYHDDDEAETDDINSNNRVK